MPAALTTFAVQSYTRIEVSSYTIGTLFDELDISVFRWQSAHRRSRRVDLRNVIYAHTSDTANAHVSRIAYWIQDALVQTFWIRLLRSNGLSIISVMVSFAEGLQQHVSQSP